MEYDFFDITKNYNDHIILKDAICYTLPIPIHWGYTEDGIVRGLAGNIIEIRWEGPFLVGVTDEFNEDHDLYALSAELSNIQSRIENNITIIESGILRAVRVCSISVIPKGWMNEPH